MNEQSEDNHWLRGTVIKCPSCETKLFAVDRSPFYDQWRLYCSGCPMAVDVSYYDSTVDQLRKNIRRGDENHALLHAAIERSLRPCDCGGRFSFTASRRCFVCGEIVVDQSGVDLSPYIGCEDTNRDPTDKEQARFDEFERRFIRRSGLWRADGDTGDANS